MPKRVIKAILPTIMTSIISIFSMTYPLIFTGAIIYSIVVDTIPGHSKKPIFFTYIWHCIFYLLSGVMGWILFVLLIYSDLDFSNLYVPALFSFLYYQILLFINQYKD
jgi:hypothetical protein